MIYKEQFVKQAIKELKAANKDINLFSLDDKIRELVDIEQQIQGDMSE